MPNALTQAANKTLRASESELKAEGVPWVPIPYADNAPIIAILEASPHGTMSRGH